MRFLLLFILVFPAALQAQHKEEITAEVKEYFGYMESGDVTRSVDYMPDKIFTMVPREQLKTLLEQTFNNPSFSIDVQKGTIQSISDQIIYEGVNYASVIYSNRMIFTMKEGADPQIFDMLLQSIEQQDVADAVESDKEQGTITVDQTSTLIAMQQEGADWKFLERNPQMIEIMKQIVPEEVLQQL